MPTVAQLLPLYRAGDTYGCYLHEDKRLMVPNPFGPGYLAKDLVVDMAAYLGRDLNTKGDAKKEAKGNAKSKAKAKPARVSNLTDMQYEELQSLRRKLSRRQDDYSVRNPAPARTTGFVMRTKRRVKRGVEDDGVTTEISVDWVWMHEADWLSDPRKEAADRKRCTALAKRMQNTERHSAHV